MSNIVIIGFWPFGQALTKILLEANSESTITVCDIHKTFVSEAIETMFVDQEHRMVWLSSVDDTQKYHAALAEADVVMLVVGSKYMTAVMKEILPHMKPGSWLTNTNKWLSPDWHICYDEFQNLSPADIHYATLAWGMAAHDVMNNIQTRATLGTTWNTNILKNIFESDLFIYEYTYDIQWVELAWVLKNIISIQAWYLQADQEIDLVRPQIDALVSECTRQIQDHATVLWIQSTTFDQTYCRDHPEYGDIGTSCYGETRNMRLWHERAKDWNLIQAIQDFEDQGITVEWVNTLRILQKNQHHPLWQLPFVQSLLKALL